MIRIGWFSPISTKTGISTYTRNVLTELHRLFPKDEVEVIVFHPATNEEVVDLPYPTIELSDSLLRSDFDSLFDIAIYHLGNNAINHEPIYKALLRHAGMVVLHDYVYQHYLAGIGHNKFISRAFAALTYNAGGADAFEFLSEGGVLACDRGVSTYTPWESEWAVNVPMCDILARLGLGAIVHSEYAHKGLGNDYHGNVCTLFMPRPEVTSPPKIAEAGKGRIHIVCGGHIQETKGLRLLVRAFAEDPGLSDQFRVTIAGFASDQTFLDQLRGEIQATGLKHTIELNVAPAEEEFMSIMASADVFYNLRYPNTEGASLSLAEQLAFGKPVIAYRTGSFAETPDDACYFLEKIGDVSEITALLEKIGKDPKDVARRGQKAWATVKDRTAEKYVRSLVGFLKKHQNDFDRRLQILGDRASDTLSAPAKKDDPWVRDYVGAHQQISGLYADSLIIPENLWEASNLERGRYVALNIIGSRVSAKNMEKIGSILNGVSDIEALAVLGHFLMLTNNKYSLSKHLNLIYLPIHDLNFWKIIVCLEPAQAIPLAFKALGAGDEPDVVREVVDDAQATGVRKAIHRHLNASRNPLLQRPGFNSVACFLERIDHSEIEKMPPVEVDGNLIKALFNDTTATWAHLQGFHPVEEAGMWTNRPEAAVFGCIPAGVSISTMTANLASFAPGIVIGDVVSIEVTEETTERKVTAQYQYALGGPHEFEMVLDLPQFKGPIQIRLITERTCSPKALGVSADPRNLGIRLHALTLTSD
jgi:glycosyltransferase involved in cell wall biosynthesis